MKTKCRHEYDLGHSSIPRWNASMRAARRQGVLEVVCYGTRSSSRVRARAPSVQHLLRGGYKHGLHAFQGGRRHHGRFGTPEKLPESKSWRRRFGACFTLTMPGSLEITRAAEGDDGGDRGRVRGVWPHRIGGQD